VCSNILILNVLKLLCANEIKLQIFIIGCSYEEMSNVWIKRYSGLFKIFSISS